MASPPTAGYQIVEADPKTPAGRRAVALDKRTIQVLRTHRRRQLDQRTEATTDGEAWTDTGYVFARTDGQPINPNYATPRYGYTTCATEPRPSPTKPAPT